MTDTDRLDLAWYVYGVLPPQGAAPAVAGVLSDASVEAVSAGALTLLVSRVPRALFDRDSSLQRTEDPDWLAARIAAHHAVNAAATAAGPCLPLNFGVLFSSLERLQDWVTPREVQLAAALARIDRHSEWALAMQQDAEGHAAWLDRHDPALQALAKAAAGAGEGTAFLLARRRDTARATAGATHIEKVAAGIAGRLNDAGFAVLPERDRSGRPAWSVLAPPDGAGLRHTIEVLAEDLSATGLSLRLSGPWPAYAFARTALGEGALHA